VTTSGATERNYIFMTTRVSASLGNFAFLSIAAAGLAFAQTPPPGTITGPYVFSETANAVVTLASLTFNADGTASGTAVVQQGVQVSIYAIQGTYIVNADNSDTLTLNGVSLDTLDTNGNPLLLNQQVLMVIPAPGNSFALLRVDAGQGTGQLIPAVQGLPAGSFVVNGRPMTPQNTSVELLTVFTNGHISGQVIANSFGQVVQRTVNGVTIAMPTGFQQIQLNVPFTDANGDPQTTTETYLALGSQSGTQMIQTAGGASGLLTLSQ
jgi:hypothetical protein